MHIPIFFCNFARFFKTALIFENNKIKYIMKALLENLGIILLIIGFVCLVVYNITTPISNALLIASLIIEVAGILAHIFINKKLQ